MWRFGFTASILWILRAFVWYGCLTALQEAFVIVLGEMELRKQVPEPQKSPCVVVRVAMGDSVPLSYMFSPRVQVPGDHLFVQGLYYNSYSQVPTTRSFWYSESWRSVSRRL